MSEMREAGLNSKSWPFEEARRVLKRYQNAPPEKGHVIFETGYGPSGLPHIGTFGEVARTSMVMRAFSELSDIPCKLICFSDDLDGMRKVPNNIPNQRMLEENLQKPLTSVPDPFDKFESFGEHNNELLKTFLNKFNFKYENYSKITDENIKSLFKVISKIITDKELSISQTQIFKKNNTNNIN